MPSRAAISRFFSPSKRLIRKTSRQRSGSASTAFCLALQLLVKAGLLGVAQKIVAVNPLLTPHAGRVLQFVTRHDTVVFQIIETGIAHHREQQRGQIQLAQFTPPLPQACKTVLHQIARRFMPGDEPGGIVHQSGIVTPEEAFEIGLVAESDAFEQPLV